MFGIQLAEAGLVPDPLIRIAIRRLLNQRAVALEEGDANSHSAAEDVFRRQLSGDPIALHTADANLQHYEVPAAYFQQVLGPRLKYSCGLWEGRVADLAGAEEAMLALTCERAEIEDGQRVLDLGCGWGSLSLWIAERHPECEVLGVSNSKSQREFILQRADQLGLRNLDVTTCDVNHFDPGQHFDRVVSVEMFEHVRNHGLLLHRIANWLTEEGKLLVHHFSHRERSYAFETGGRNDWMGRHFFTGGIMPSHDMLLRCQEDLRVERRWRVSGRHYQQTCEAWLQRHDENREQVRAALGDGRSAAEAHRWFHRWRLFHLACAELFGFRDGNEWSVSHVLLDRVRGRL